MGKIKGWEKFADQDDIIAWQTTSRPILTVWINREGTPLTKTGRYVVSNDFKTPIEKYFTNKKEAMKYANKLMRNNKAEDAFKA